MPTLKEVHALKEKLKGHKAVKADGAAAFREIAAELKAARAADDTAKCPRCPPRSNLADALDAVAAHLEDAAKELEG